MPETKCCGHLVETTGDTTDVDGTRKHCPLAVLVSKVSDKSYLEQVPVMGKY